MYSINESSSMTNNNPSDILFGIDTFGDLAVDDNGMLLSHAASIRQVLDEAVLADTIGIDVIAVGEHHRSEYAISSPEMVLAGIATRTSRIKLSSGVTVLSSDDPVRVFERFATLDALSNGRAQIILGRGSFTESFPLFGYDLKDYEVLFEEKIELFSKLRSEKPVTWHGTTREPLDKADVFPKTESGSLETFVGVGGSPESIIRAAKYGFPVMLAIIGGSPDRFIPYAKLYKQATKELGTLTLPLGMHSPGFIAETDEEAQRIAWPRYKKSYDKIGRSRGWAPFSKEQFDQEIIHGSMYIGSPETVAQKMAQAIKTLGVGRFDLVYGGGPMPASARLKMIELYGTKVIPRVRELLREDKVLS
jgi:probable LLM family oxidoreductase